jgi:hypothetical protein
MARQSRSSENAPPFGDDERRATNDELSSADSHHSSFVIRHSSFLGSLIFLLLYIAQSSFTVSDLFITHYAAGLPFLFVIAGLAVAVCGHAAGRPGLALALALILAWSATDLVSDVRYHQTLAYTGGHGTHSDAIYGLAGYLIQRSNQPVVALDWGMDAPVRFLTAGKVNPVELFGYTRLDAPDPAFAERLAPYLKRPDTLYLFRAASDTIYQGRLPVLEEMAASAHRKLVIDQAPRERTRRRAFVVYRLEPHEPPR